MYQQVGKTTETNGGYSLSCDQVDRHPIGLELETLSEVIFFFNPSFKKRVKDRKLPTEHVFFFFLLYKVHFLFMRGAQLNFKVAQSAGRRLNAAFSLLLLRRPSCRQVPPSAHGSLKARR